VLRLVAALRVPRPVVVTSAAPGSAGREALDAVLADQGLAVLSWAADGSVEVRPPARPRAGPVLPAAALVLPTSGSTGRPRLVVDVGVRSAPGRPPATRLTARLGWRPGQRQLQVGPPAHASVLTFFVAGLADGNTVLLTDGFHPEELLVAVERERVEWLQLTPYQLGRLRRCPMLERADLSSVRALLHMSAACRPEEKRFWHRRLGAARVYEHFGSSEGIGATVARGDEWEARPGTVGRGFFTQLRVLDPATGRPVPTGEVGEVWMRSAASRDSVYLDSGRRLRRTVDGFVTVGDRGRLDSDGFLYPAPRQVGRITVGGHTVLAADVEEVLAAHPAVRDAAVAGVADDRFGQRVAALVVPAPGVPVTDTELRTWVRRRMPPAAVPRQIARADRVPRTSTGKVVRDALDVHLRAAVRPGGHR
jgi:bile acid-coenzyme A ligase